jgi:sugar (pentulose or hexulose) kinase
MEDVIAVFDIGKSNKKFIVFSEDLKPILSQSTRIDEVTLNNILCDDVDSIIPWMKSSLSEASKNWRVKALSITAFGATIAHLKGGVLRLPVVSYNQDIEAHIRRKFYDEFGSPLELYMTTGTPPYGQLLNAGIQVYWVKEKFPEVFSEVDEVLFLPQFLTYIITGFKASEVTSIGCHTYLYDVPKKGWSKVAEDLMVDERSPEVVNVWEALGEFKSHGSRILVTPGLHDSNACLLPYIARGGEFVLASTGTWCVFMHPGEPFNPRGEDLYMDVLYYIDAYNRPVKSSRFKGGYEYDYYTGVIKESFLVDPHSIPFDVDLLNEILRRRGDFIAPGLVSGSGQFQGSRAEIIGDAFHRSAREAYHLLNLYLAIESYVAIKLIGGGRSLDIIVQGGFAKNNIYLNILSALFPKSRVLKAAFPEATGLGAALCAKCALENLKPNEIYVDLIGLGEVEVEKPPIDDESLQKYIDAFIERFSGG